MEQHLVCRLCLESISDYCEDITGIKEDLLKFAVTEIDLNLSSNPKMCKRCSGNLRNCYEFKSVCLENNETLEESVNIKDEVPNAVKKEENSEVCRLCLLEKNIFETLDSTNRDGFLKEMLQQCLPELNCNQGAICEACFESFKNFYAFLNYCVVTEEKIKTYCEVRGTDTKCQVDLYEVYKFTHRSLANVESLIAPKENNNLKNYFAVLIKVDSNFEVKFHGDENYIVPNDNSDTKLEYNAKDSYEDNLSLESEKVEIHDEGPALKTDPSSVALSTHEPEQDRCASTKEPLHLKNGEFMCDICGFVTQRRKYLHNHVKNRHKQPPKIKCIFCPYRSKRNCDLAKHLSTHKNAKLPTCEEEINATNATSKNLLTCKTCPYKTSERQYLIIHSMSHETEALYACKICPHVAKTKGRLGAHMHVHRDPAELPTFTCALCSFQTTRKVYLHKHMGSIHRNPASIIMHKCTKCSYSTKRKEDLVKHLICHEERNIMCDHCSFRTNNKGSLRRHIRKIHNIEAGQ